MRPVSTQRWPVSRARGPCRALPGDGPHGHWQAATFIAALRHVRLSASWTVDSLMDGPLFLACVTEVLEPELQQRDLVICDNFSSHKVHGIAEAMVSRGATLHYLPAYSPDPNPIEMAFAKLKALVRRAAARTYDQLIEAVAQSLNCFSASQNASTSFAMPNTSQINWKML